MDEGVAMTSQSAVGGAWEKLAVPRLPRTWFTSSTTNITAELGLFNFFRIQSSLCSESSYEVIVWHQ